MHSSVSFPLSLWTDAFACPTGTFTIASCRVLTLLLPAAGSLRVLMIILRLLSKKIKYMPVSVLHICRCTYGIQLLKCTFDILNSSSMNISYNYKSVVVSQTCKSVEPYSWYEMCL
jgi:hypothetical protein